MASTSAKNNKQLPGGPIPAAVLIPLFIGGSATDKTLELKTKTGVVRIPLDTKVLLTVRTHTVEHHKGQISFPGGRFEEEDGSLETTALRETHEEVGLHPSEVEVVAEMPHLLTVASQFTVTPYVGVVKNDSALTPNPDEIGEILFVPLSHFLDPTHTNIETHQRNGVSYRIPAYHFGHHRIWGATGLMIQTLLEKFILSR